MASSHNIDHHFFTKAPHLGNKTSSRYHGNGYRMGTQLADEGNRGEVLHEEGVCYVHRFTHVHRKSRVDICWATRLKNTTDTGSSVQQKASQTRCSNLKRFSVSTNHALSGYLLKFICPSTRTRKGPQVLNNRTTHQFQACPTPVYNPSMQSPTTVSITSFATGHKTANADLVNCVHESMSKILY